jgi:hypothetical protein
MKAWLVLAGSGCFKNLEEWIDFLKPSNDRQRTHGSLASFGELG